jgi:hypothetical protein
MLTGITAAVLIRTVSLPLVKSCIGGTGAGRSIVKGPHPR